MARRIHLDLEGISAIAELRDDLSPRMAEAFWISLPIERPLSPAKWSGLGCFLHPESDAMREVTELEHPVCSIYPGTIVARPGGSEILMSYGASEYRWGIGTDYTTPIATIVENFAAFRETLARTHDVGAKHIAIRQVA
jgi:hypothetical protein